MYVYVLSFQMKAGPERSFAKRSDAPSDRTLFWINDWCQKNTSKVFGDGIVALALTRRE
jgi:hypothetical protein